MFRVNIQNVLRRLQRRLPVACTIHWSRCHFLVQTVPFLFDTLAQLFHVRDPVVIVHTLLQDPPHSVMDGVQIRLFSGHVAYRIRTASCARPIATDQRSTMPVASILLSTVLTPLNVKFLFGNILSIFVAP